jgi:DNA-binding MarR family transcriptional regulator
MKFRLIINSTKRHFKWVEEQCGINGAQLWAIWEIHRAGRLTVNDLAAAMAMHQSTISILVNKLVRAKLVARARSKKDQRVVELTITAAGKKLLQRAPKPARGVLPEAVHRLPSATQASLNRLLGLLLREMSATDDGSMGRPLAEILGHNYGSGLASAPDSPTGAPSPKK